VGVGVDDPVPGVIGGWPDDEIGVAVPGLEHATSAAAPASAAMRAKPRTFLPHIDLLA
jgi:hypothetical protein